MERGRSSQLTLRLTKPGQKPGIYCAKFQLAPPPPPAPRHKTHTRTHTHTHTQITHAPPPPPTHTHRSHMHPHSTSHSPWSEDDWEHAPLSLCRSVQSVKRLAPRGVGRRSECCTLTQYLEWCNLTPVPLHLTTGPAPVSCRMSQTAPMTATLCFANGEELKPAGFSLFGWRKTKLSLDSYSNVLV